MVKMGGIRSGLVPSSIALFRLVAAETPVMTSRVAVSPSCKQRLTMYRPLASRRLKALLLVCAPLFSSLAMAVGVYMTDGGEGWRQIVL
nr:unnamed protein product [Digitaria exilis]